MLLYLQQNVLTVQCRNLCSKTHGLSPENPAKVSTPNTTSTMFPAASPVIHSWTSAPTATSCHVGASRSNTRFWGMESLFVWVIIANLILNIYECVSARMTFSNPSLVDFRVTRVHCSIISNIGPCWCISRLVVLHKLPPSHHCQHYHHQDCKFEKEVCGYSFDEYITVNHSVSSFILLDMLVQISCHLELIEVCIYAVVSFLCYKYSDSYLCGLYYILFCLLRHCPRKAVLPTSPHHTIQQWKLWKNFTEFVYTIYLWFLCYKRFLLHIQNFSIYW